MNTRVTLKTVPMFERETFYPEELILFFRHLDKTHNKNLCNFKLAYNIGARYNEMRHIKVEDIFFQIPMVNLRVTKGRGKAKSGEKKVGMPRQVKISEEMARDLKKHISFNNLKQGDYLFTVANSTLNRTIKRELERMGHPRPDMFSIHDFRKTHITHRIALGETIDRISLECGHDEDTEKKHYASPDLFTTEQKLMMIDLLGKKISKFM